VALALADGVITSATSVLDYGCGHGGDVRYLTSRGVPTAGWDPYFAPDQPRGRADVVNLGYVLNVIEDPLERVATLRAASELANNALVVSVRVDNTLDDAPEYGDGVLTGKGTFQKIYTQEEFKSYVEATLGRRVHTAALGVGYVFASEAAEQRYVAGKVFTRRLEYRADLIAEFEADATAHKYVDLANALGRIPMPVEFPEYERLLSAFGSVQRIERLLLSKINGEAYEGSRAERRNDMLVYLALLRLQSMQPPPFRALPISVQADVKAIWGSYDRAKRQGEEFLFSLGNPSAVKIACVASSVGKLLPGDLYVHKSAEEELPALVRVVIAAAKQIIGDVAYDLTKVALDGRAVSFLSYPGFNDVAHPPLMRSVRVYLPKAAFDVRDYSSVANPPILHRKDRFVTQVYPLYQQFRDLTEQEEAAGLLAGGDIGFRAGWEALLSAYRFKIEGHKLVRAS
jgi:DNA phosphorothioation-associated putative methyltransferase